MFYFRDPAYVDGFTLEERQDYVSEDSAAKEKLRRLKDQIRASKLSLVENYPGPPGAGQACPG